MLTVHVRVNDTGTGKPTPVRLQILGPGRASYTPFGRLEEFATAPGRDVGGSVLLGTQKFAYIDGSCEVQLPPGPLDLQIYKGPEYTPLIQDVVLGPGQISLRCGISRWTDLRADNWYSGDTRATDLTPHAALLEAAAEDLAVVNLLAYERPPQDGACAALSNLLAFSGTGPALERPGHLVAVNTLNHHPTLGTLALLHSHRPVYPLRFGGPDREDNWSLADWCGQCHRKAGLVVWPDVPRLTPEHPQGEALALAIPGKVDAFEISSFPDPEPANLGDWYRLLDCGLRLPLAGGSGKDSNRVALGSVRTYARLAGDATFSYGSWIEAVRAGRTFVTNGPLLKLTAGGQGVGGTVQFSEVGPLVPVVVDVGSVVPFDQVEVLFNGSVVLSKEASGNRTSTRVEGELRLTESGWLAARCWGRDWLPGPGKGQCVYAHTSPIYVNFADRPRRRDPAAVAEFAKILAATAHWVGTAARGATTQVLSEAQRVLGEIVS